MEVSIQVYGTVRHIIGDSRTVLQLPDGATVGDLLDGLALKYGESLRQALLDSQGGLQRTVELFVGNRQVEGLQEKVGKDQRVDIYVLSPVAGGEM